MHTGIRRGIMIAGILIFLLGGTYMILIASGWTLDWMTGGIIKTGGLFLNFEPADARVALDGVLRPETSGILSSGILIEKLAPREYRVMVTKPGYSVWEKKLVVDPGQVTTAQTIRLWPLNPSTEVEEKDVRAFWQTSEGLVTQDTDGKLFIEKRPLKGTEVIAADPASPLLVTKEKQDYFVSDITRLDSVTNLTKLFNSLRSQQLKIRSASPIEEIQLHPFSSQKLLIRTQFALYLLDQKQIKLEKILEANATTTALALSDASAFLTDQEGSLYSTHLILQGSASTTPHTVPTTLAFVASPNGKYLAFRTTTGTLELYNTNQETLHTIAQHVMRVAWNSDSQRLLYATAEGTVGVYYLEKMEGDTSHPAGSRDVFILPEARNANQMEWLRFAPNTIALASAAHGFIVAETDARAPINRALLSSEGIAFRQDGTSLYVLQKNGDLLRLSPSSTQ